MAPLAAGGPWFRQHPRLAAAVTIATFTAVTVLRIVTDDADDGAGVLYALPVALAAMAFGRAIGTAASLSAAGLLWAWALGHPESTQGFVGWGTRVLPILVLGVLLGASADAAEATARARTELAVAAARRRDAAEVNDAILQRLAVAKWRLEAGAGEEAAALLQEAIGEGQALVSSLLAADPVDDRLRVRAGARAPQGIGANALHGNG